MYTDVTDPVSPSIKSVPVSLLCSLDADKPILSQVYIVSSVDSGLCQSYVELPPQILPFSVCFECFISGVLEEHFEVSVCQLVKLSSGVLCAICLKFGRSLIFLISSWTVKFAVHCMGSMCTGKVYLNCLVLTSLSAACALFFWLTLYDYLKDLEGK